MNKNNIILLFIIIIIIITVIPLCRESFADIYIYTDSSGQVCFTDVPPNENSKLYIKEKNNEKSEKVTGYNKLNHNEKNLISKTQQSIPDFSIKQKSNLILSFVFVLVIGLFLYLIIRKRLINYNENQIKNEREQSSNLHSHKEKNTDFGNQYVEKFEPIAKTGKEEIIAENNLININIIEFAKVSIRHPDIWTTIIGARLSHKILGEGEITRFKQHYIYVNFVGEEEESIFDSGSFRDGVFEYLKISNEQLSKIQNWIKEHKEKQDQIKKYKKRKKNLINKTLKKDIHKIIWVKIVPGSNFHSHWKSEMQIVKTNWGTYIDNITNPKDTSLQPGFDWSSILGQTVDNVSITYSKGYEWINRKICESYDYDDEKMDDGEMEEEDGFFWGDWWPNDDFHKDN